MDECVKVNERVARLEEWKEHNATPTMDDIVIKLEKMEERFLSMDRKMNYVLFIIALFFVSQGIALFPAIARALPNLLLP